MARRRRFPEIDVARLEPVTPARDVDLRTDLHGHAIDYANDLDRSYFAEHPDEADYTRRPVPHEWCLPELGGGCLEPKDEPAFVIVRFLGEGLRMREPYFGVATP